MPTSAAPLLMNILCLGGMFEEEVVGVKDHLFVAFERDIGVQLDGVTWVESLLVLLVSADRPSLCRL